MSEDYHIFPLVVEIAALKWSLCPDFAQIQKCDIYTPFHIWNC
jgi:hypothetical protein